MSKIWELSLFSPRLFAAVMVAMVLAAQARSADISGTIAEPEVISARTLSPDVSAFYLGISGGYGSGGSDQFGLRTPGGLVGIGNLRPDGGYGGVRAGWRGIVPVRGGRDYVYGIEIGFDPGELSDSSTAQFLGTTVTAESSIEDVFSLRLRSGLTNRRRTVLYFASVGYVRGDITTSSTIEAATTQVFRDRDSRGGFSVSVGAEHQLTDRWSITGEIEYVQFESETVDLGPSFTTKSTPNYRGLRFGLNYTF